MTAVFKRTLLLSLFGAFAVGGLKAQTDSVYRGNLAKIEQWRNDRFGLFIHWGPSSVIGKEMSWSRGRDISVEEYDKLYKRFDPSGFDAEEIVDLARRAGMRYVVLTAKHHDGFCMWNTRQTSYNIMQTPFGRDIVGELAAACEKYGLAFGVYYSTCDWHHPDFPLTGQGGTVERDSSNLDNYTTYLKRQIAELLVNYGPLNTLWFDYPQLFDARRGEGVIELARALQPDIIINSRTGAKGDFDTPEQRVGGYSTERPWETCMTIARQWGWAPGDEVKSLHQCLHTLIRAVGSGGNFLLNIGPRPDGRIEPSHRERLLQIGQWLDQYGETIYGTQAGPYLPADWGTSTRKGNTIYVHVLSWKEGNPEIILPKPEGLTLESYRLLTGGKLKMKEQSGNYVFEISGSENGVIDRIIELKMSGDVLTLPVMPTANESFLIGRKVLASTNPDPVWHDAQFVCDGDWAGLGWVPSDEDPTPWIEVDMGDVRRLSRAFIYENTRDSIAGFEIQIWRDRSWKTVAKGDRVGKSLAVDLPHVRARKVRLRITRMNGVPEISEFLVL